LAVLLFAVVLVLVLFLLARTDWAREKARAVALERLRQAVNGRVEVGRLEGDLLRGVRIENVSITGPRGEPFLSVRRLEVDYEAGGFLHKRILLGDVRLVEPRIALVQDSTGRWNYLEILPFLRGREKPGPPGWGSVVRVDSLRVVNGSVSIATRREAAVFGPLGQAPEIVGVNGGIALDISSEGEGRKRFAAEDLTFRLLEPALDVRELDARAAFTPAGLELDRFLLRTAASRLSGSGTIRNLADPVFDLDFQAEPLDLAEIDRFLPGVPYKQGSVRGRVGLVGPAADLEVTLEDFALRTPGSTITGRGTVTTRQGPDIRAELTLAPLAPADVRVWWRGYPFEDPVSGRVALRGTRAELTVDADLSYAGTRGTVAGSLRLSGRAPAYDLQASVQGLDLHDIFHDPAWASTINGDFRIAGSGLGTSAHAEFGGAFRDSRILFYDIRSGSFQGRFRPGAYEVDAFRLQLPSSEIEGSGILPYDFTLDLQVRGASRNLQDFYPGLGATPARWFTGAGRLAGPYSGIDLTLEANADSLAWNGLVADTLQGTASFTDLGRPSFRMRLLGEGRDVIYLGLLRFQSGEFLAEFADDTMGVTVAMRMDSLRTAQGHLNVDLSAPKPLIVLDRGAAQIGDEEYVVEEPSGFAYQDGVFRFDDFALVHAEERAAIDGVLRPEGTEDFTFEFRHVSIDDLQTLAGVEPFVVGTLDASGTVAGTDRAPVIGGEFQLTGGRVGRLRVRQLEGRVDYAERRLGLDVDFAPQTAGADSADPGSIRVSGSLPVDLALGRLPERILDAPMDLSAESRGLSLAVIQAFAPQPVRASGPLRFSLRLTGRPSDPRLAGELELEEGRVANLAIHRFQGSLDYAERQLGFDLALQPETATADTLNNAGTLTARGTFPLDLSLRPGARRIPDQPIDVRVESEGLSLALLRSFSPSLADASGPVEVSLRLVGRPSAPDYQGSISVRDGILKLERGARYTGIQGTVRFDNDEIAFEEVRASSATGDARLTGRIAVRELTLGDIQATLEARGFTLIDEDDKLLVVDADIDLGGTTQEPSVIGKLNVAQAGWPLQEQSERDVIDLDQAILYVRAEGDTVPPAPPPDVWRQTLVDLDVTVEDDALLKSEQALIVLQGDLSIEKRRGRDLPSMSGTLEVVRGFYSDFGNQFEVQEGEVFFYGTPDLNPGLHIVATTTVPNAATGQDVEVTLTLGGTLERPTLELSSTPVFEKAEIFSLLLFGSPSPDLTQQRQFESTLTRVAASQASLPLQRALASELGLDLLEIQPSAGGYGPGVRAGKYVAPDVFVTYQQVPGPLEESRFGIQYRLSRRWTLETQAGTRQLVADIFYEFQY
jgi:autotransporter translocation and assembly factor TamB